MAGENCIVSIFITCSFHQLEFKVKESETGRACSMHGEKVNAYPILVGKTPLVEHALK
jgi:hypothetical protein